ncbi:prostatic acid phosphatase-like [Bradysia coprophila]|uniref:prostatic acid phosphatase-like n=1 Tax=Bradysia coprophila TaxID=38358 RepID=UPI00187DB16E|nr:prostatic acid phosphatase-like [Bradysia coprophila]
MILFFIFGFILYSTANTVSGQPNRNSSDERGELLFVQLLFRHGDRTPLSFYKNDPWKDQKNWDHEPGQLTNLGKQQEFELGLYIRDRYADFLDPTYSENDIYVQSSNITRTILSAQAFLTGVYKPETSPDFWTSNLPWNPPFTVHTTPRKVDNLIHANTKCAAFSKHFDAFLQLDEIKEFDRKHKELYDYLSLHSGDNVEKMSDTVPIRDTLWIESIHNKSLPDWTKRVLRGGDLYDNLEETFLKTFRLDTSTQFMAKIKGGFLLKDILDRFTNKSKSLLEPDRKLWVYSGHDSTIIRLLNSLGILETVPNVSTCVLFEMRNINNVPHIEIFWKDASAAAVPLRIPNCGLSCPLADFYVLYKNVLPTKSFEEECMVPENERSNAGKNASKFILQIIALSVLLKQFMY